MAEYDDFPGPEDIRDAVERAHQMRAEAIRDSFKDFVAFVAAPFRREVGVKRDV